MEQRSYGMLVVAALVALGAVGIAVFTTHYAGNTGGAPVAVVDTTQSHDSLGDADQDGVPDWKEILWGLDPQNPDTDGNGIPDGDEIENKTAESLSATALEPYIAPKALPPSEAAARELYAGYAAALQDGTLSSSEISSVVSSVLERNTESKTDARIYTLGDFTHGNSVSTDTYRTELLATLKGMGVIREYELTTFGKIVETGDGAGISKLENAAAVYRSTVDALLKLRVPDSAATQHLAALNSLSELAAATDGLTKWNGDPLDAMVRVDAFASAENNFADDISALYSRIF